LVLALPPVVAEERWRLEQERLPVQVVALQRLLEFEESRWLVEAPEQRPVRLEA
jgi:hypothetical protein